MPTDLTGYPDDFALLLTEYNTELAGIMSGLESGSLSSSDWEKKMQGQLAKYTQAAKILGTGTTDPLAPADKIASGKWLDDQLKYLSGFSSVISSSSDYNPAWSARAQMYGASTYTQYWEGKSENLALPAMPAQGTQCLSNCKCSWRIEWIDKEKGDADCYWELSAAEHCQTCIERARMWNPIRIRGGLIEEGAGPAKPAGQPTPPKTPPPSTPEATPVNPTSHIKVTKKWADKETGKAVNSTLEAVDKVHRLPAKMRGSRISPVESAGSETTQGSYHPGTRKISVKLGIDFPMETTAHEVGHWIDSQDLGHPGKYSSEITGKRSPGDKAFQAYHKAVQASPSYQKLKQMANTGEVVLSSGRTVPVSQANMNWLHYALSEREVWARTYSQYIAVRSQNAQMLSELGFNQMENHTFPQVWQNDEFVPIADAIDKIFEANGLLK